MGKGFLRVGFKGLVFGSRVVVFSYWLGLRAGFLVLGFGSRVTEWFLWNGFSIFFLSGFGFWFKGMVLLLDVVLYWFLLSTLL